MGAPPTGAPEGASSGGTKQGNEWHQAWVPNESTKLGAPCGGKQGHKETDNTEGRKHNDKIKR